MTTDANNIARRYPELPAAARLVPMTSCRAS